jgi:hypothetical protein
LSTLEDGINSTLASGLLKLDRTIVPPALVPLYTWALAISGAINNDNNNDKVIVIAIARHNRTTDGDILFFIFAPHSKDIDQNCAQIT